MRHNPLSPPRRAAGLVLILAVIYGLYLVVGFATGPIARPMAEDAVSEATGRKADLEALSFNPFTWAVTATGFSLAGDGPDQPLAAFSRLRVNFDPLRFVFGAVAVGDISLETPSVHLVVREDGSLNVLDPAQGDTWGTGEANEDDDGSVLPFVVSDIAVSNGSLVVDDRMNDTVHDVTDITFSLPFASSLEKTSRRFVTPRLSFAVGNTTVTATGRTLPFDATRRTEFTLDLAPLHLVDYRNYLPLPKPLTLAGGSLAANASFVFEQAEGETRFMVRATARLAGLALDHGRERVASLDRAEVQVGNYSPLEATLWIERIALDALRTTLHRTPDAPLGWLGAFLPQPAGDSSPPADHGDEDANSGFTLRLDTVRMPKATFDYADDTLASPFKRTVTADLSLDDFDTGSAAPAPFSLHLVSDTGETLAAKGTLAPEFDRIRAEAAAGGIEAAAYAPFYRSHLPVEITGGLVAANATVEMAFSPEFTLNVANATAGLDDISLRHQGRELAGLARLETAGLDLDLKARRVAARSLRLVGPRAHLVRQADGSLLLPLPEDDDPPAEMIAAKSAPQEREQEPGWSVALARAELEDGLAGFTDNAVPGGPVVELRALDVLAKDMAWPLAQPFTVRGAFSLGDKGSVEATARVAQGPDITGTVSARNLPLALAAPWIAAHAGVAPARGRATAEGRWSLDKTLAPAFQGTVHVGDVMLRDTEKGKKAASLAALDADGVDATTTSARIGRLALEGATLYTPGDDDPAAALAALDLDELRLDYAPFSLSAGQTRLTGPEFEVIVYADGDLNLAHAFDPFTGQQADASKSPPPPAEDKASGGAGPPLVSLGATRIDAGSVSFEDRRPGEPFRVRLHDLFAETTPLTLPLNNPVTLTANGTVDRSAGLNLNATASSLLDALAASFRVRIANMSMSTFTPYTRHYLGHTVTSGQLFATVTGDIDGMRLQADNDIRIENFEVGRWVEANATSGDLRTGLALLRDSSGTVALNLPVNGRLDSPNFSFAGVFFSALSNSLVKLALSPFRLFTGLTSFILPGQSEADISIIEFAPGTARLDEKDRTKLAAVGEAMGKRQDLVLTVAGYASDEADRRALTEQALEDALRKAGYRQSASEAKRDEALKKAYKAADLPSIKPLKSDSATETMRARLLDHLRAERSDLRNLAHARSEAVKRYLTTERGVEPDRVVIETDYVLRAPNDPQVRGERAELGLQVR